MVLDGVRLTSPARTWLDLAQLMSIDDTVAAGDSIVVEHGDNHPRPREPLATIDDLKAMVSARPGMRGVRKARLALHLVPGRRPMPLTSKSGSPSNTTGGIMGKLSSTRGTSIGF
jgi:hypothetical protein